MTPEQIALAVEAQARAYAALKHVGSKEQAAALLSPEALEALLTSQPRVWTANDIRAALLEADRDPEDGESFAEQFAKSLNKIASATAGKDEP